MQEIISTQTVEQWAHDFIEELKGVKLRNDELQQKIVEKTNFIRIKELYNNARKRLILLDYDGTLVPFRNDARKAFPTPSLITLLQKLADDPRNYVVISSGRDKATLDTWLGGLPIGLAAEHGAFYKEKGEWHANGEEMHWDEEILRIMKHMVKKTRGSKLEIKKTAVVWHYREVDVWLAELRVNQLLNALIAPCARLNLTVMKGNKIIEVKASGYSKGAEAIRLIGKGNYDFIMAIGDDTTDEEMFQTLPKESITIKVGKNTNAAMYNIPTQKQTIIFLSDLIKEEPVPETRQHP